MSAQHTQMQLTVNSLYPIQIATSANPISLVAQAVVGHPYTEQEAVDIARRLVACWNACVGVEADMIEAAGDGLLAKALGRVGEKHEAMRFAEAQRDELLAVASNFEISGPDDDGLVWLILHGKGTTGRAMFQLGKPAQIAVQTAMHLEQDRRAAIAKVKGGAA